MMYSWEKIPTRRLQIYLLSPQVLRRKRCDRCRGTPLRYIPPPPPRGICVRSLTTAAATWRHRNTMTSSLLRQHTHTHPFNGPLSMTTRVGRYQKGKTNLDFTEARDTELQWNSLGYMQVCTLLQTDNHASTPPLSFLQARCPSCRPTNSVKALKARALKARNQHCFTSVVATTALRV